MAFRLDPALARDCYQIAESEASLLLLMNDQRYTWLILVPKLANISEWHDLPTATQIDLHRLSVKIGAHIKQIMEADKINLATLGNVVSQFHIHIVARNKNDPAWPGPVWGHSPAQPYQAEELSKKLNELKLETIFSAVD